MTKENVFIKYTTFKLFGAQTLSLRYDNNKKFDLIHTLTHTPTYIHTLTHTNLHTHTYTHTNLHTHTYTHTNLHTHTHTHTHTHKHTHTLTSTHPHPPTHFHPHTPWVVFLKQLLQKGVGDKSCLCNELRSEAAAVDVTAVKSTTAEAVAAKASVAISIRKRIIWFRIKILNKLIPT